LGKINTAQDIEVLKSMTRLGQDNTGRKQKAAVGREYLTDLVFIRDA
jgi:hypothetical protein